MHRMLRPSRSVSIFGCAAALAVLAAPTQTARAEEGDVSASMQCDKAPEPGRVRCSVEARTKNGRALAWADVAILELPDFAAALKGRIGADGVVAHDATSEKWAFGIVARSAGRGDARARVRMVVCDAPPGEAGAGRCAPVTLDVKAVIQVG
jgi:hypothetical protein